MKVPTWLGTLTILLLSLSSARADYVIDFNGPFPDDAKVWRVPYSSTCSAEIVQMGGGNGVGQIKEARPPMFGGTLWAGVYKLGPYADVLVGAIVNPLQNTDDKLGVFARNIDPGKYYFTTLDFTTGNFIIYKPIPNGNGQYLATADEPLTDLSRSYYIEMDVVGLSAPQITARLFDEQGGTELRRISAIDTGIGGPVYGSGHAGTHSGTTVDGMLDVSFDDISVTTIAPATLISVATGDWNAVETWNHGTLTPGYMDNVFVRSDTVAVTSDSVAGSLSINRGRVVVQDGATLAITRIVQIDYGTLELAAAGVLQANGEVRFGESSQFVCQVGQESNGMILASTDSGDVVLSPGSSLQFQVSGASMFKAGSRTLMLTAGTNGITGQFETANGLGDYVTGDWLSYNSGWLSLTIDKDLNPGDADLSTTTDLTDFNLWNANKFTSDTDWGTGDFNGDGTTDLSDFNIWNAAKFTSAGGGAAPAPTQVPEPSTLVLLCFALLAATLRLCKPMSCKS